MACKYPSPAFNRRVSVQQPGGTTDAYGERITTWTTVATVWAAIMQSSIGLGARELLAAGALHGELTHRVQVRYTAALAAADASWRILFGSRVLVLTGPPRNINEGNRIIEFLCAEGVVEE